MQNVALSIDGNILTITVDLSVRDGKSASKKHTIIATTNGPVALPYPADAVVTLNVYTK